MLFTAKKAQTLVEYALIMAWVVLVVMILLASLGGNIRSFFSQVTNTLQSAAS